MALPCAFAGHPQHESPACVSSRGRVLRPKGYRFGLVTGARSTETSASHSWPKPERIKSAGDCADGDSCAASNAGKGFG